MAKQKTEKEDGLKVVVRNRKARYDYEIVDTLEAGLVLVGSEVKSLRAGKVSLSDAYASPKGNELYLVNLHISPYDKATGEPHEPLRSRKLLLHKRQRHRKGEWLYSKSFPKLVWYRIRYSAQPALYVRPGKPGKARSCSTAL